MWLSKVPLHKWVTKDAIVCLEFWKSLWPKEPSIPEQMIFCEILSRHPRDVVLHAMRDMVADGTKFRPNPGEIRDLCLESTPTHSPAGELPPPEDVVPADQVKDLVNGLIDHFRQKGEWDEGEEDPGEVPYEPITTKRVREAMQCAGDTTLVEVRVHAMLTKKEAKSLRNLTFTLDKANRYWHTQTSVENLDTIHEMVEEVRDGLEATAVGWRKEAGEWMPVP